MPYFTRTWPAEVYRHFAFSHRHALNNRFEDSLLIIHRHGWPVPNEVLRLGCHFFDRQVMRKGYGKLLRAEIAKNVSDPAEVEDELQAVLAALSY